MLVHLSSSSPYICDLSLGPIEQANRMSSARLKQSYLEIKESFPRLQPVRTPLKLLAPDEVPMDTSVSTATDVNTSRQASLQPVWYTEQTIVDDQNAIPSSPTRRLNLTRSPLPTIASNSPDVVVIQDEIIEKEPLLQQKSSTFTLEPHESILNDSEKENNVQHMITSTQKDPTRHPTEPSDESFRALEHLLGLGSTQANLTMTTTAQESPKSNHESLSLTVVTPTEIVNQTANSFLSYVPAGSGSLPSSQNVLLMPTIESITEPSINSTMPPPFSVDNTDTEEEVEEEVIEEEEEQASAIGTVVDPDSIDDKEDSNDFSFELNDFTNDSTPPTPDVPPPPPPPMITIRPPTSADVAYRALMKARTSARTSQPIKAQSPLVKTLTARASVPNLPTRVLRSSKRRDSSSSQSQNSTIEQINETKSVDEDCPPIELVEVVSLSEDEGTELESNNDVSTTEPVTLNLTATKELDTTSPTSAEEADRSASTTCSSFMPTPTDPKQPVLSREFTYNTPTIRPTRSSERRRSITINRPSPKRLTQSLVPIKPIIIEETKDEEEEEDDEPPSLYSKSFLSNLSTNPTVTSEAPPIILQKSLVGSASPSPNATPTLPMQEQEYTSPRRSINPLHSSTPSVRNKSLQLVSIGEQEQVSTTVPQQLTMNLTNDDIEMIDNEQQTDVPLRIHHVTDEGMQTSPERPPRRIDIAVQTTPSLDPSSRRRFQTIEQQTSPIAIRASASSSCQTTPIATRISATSSCQTTPAVVKRMSHIPTAVIQQQITPVHTKAIVHLQRNVRFQFTPSTDARLTAKEKLEEEQLKMKKEIIVEKQTISDNEREDDTEDEIKKTKKKIPTSKKKKAIPVVEVDDSSEETNESPVLRTTRHTKSHSTESDVKSKPSKRTAARQEKKSEPHQEVIEPTKRTINRKRPNPKTSNVSPTTSPTEPIPKRTKTSVTEEATPSPEQQSAPKKMKKSASENQLQESSTNNKRKTNTIVAAKKSKRRLHSVEQDEGLNTADEEEPTPNTIEKFDLTAEEREKIEGSTVAELKTRLTTHGENIPKGARKAELIALVIQIETNLLKQKKQAETVVVEPMEVARSRKTRRKK